MMGIMTTTVDSSDSMPERLQEGSAAPDFTLPAVIPGFTESGSINLSDVLDAGRRVVLYFYPAAMTPGCTTEACDFRDNLARLASKNVTVLGVSKDSRDKLRKFAQRDHLTFPLLSDPDLTVVPEKLRTLERGRPWRDSQFASTRLSPSRDMSR